MGFLCNCGISIEVPITKFNVETPGIDGKNVDIEVSGVKNGEKEQTPIRNIRNVK